MSFLELFFSTRGRMNRSVYSTVSFAALLLFGGLASVFLGLALGQSHVEGFAELKKGPFAVFSIAPVAAVLMLLALWVQICLVFKRSRDFSGDTGFAKIYVIFSLGPLIAVPALSGTVSVLVQFIVVIPLFIMSFMLMAKGSTDAELAEIIAPSLALEEPLADAMSDIDLVARAAELNARAAVVAPVPAKPKAPQQFARRQSVGFGNR